MAARPGSVVLGGRRVPVDRLRSRTLDGHKVRLATWQAFTDDDLLGQVVMERMLAGPATRRHRAAAAEGWIRTLKDQCLWVQLHDTVDELRQAVAGFVDRYNSSWLNQRHEHLTPKGGLPGSTISPSSMTG